MIDLERAVTMGLDNVPREEESIHQFDLAVCRAGAEAQREADAVMVSAAGCVCRCLYLSSRRSRHTCGYDGDFRFEGDDFNIIRHDSRCPQALAAKIRRQP